MTMAWFIHRVRGSGGLCVVWIVLCWSVAAYGQRVTHGPASRPSPSRPVTALPPSAPAAEEPARNWRSRTLP